MRASDQTETKYTVITAATAKELKKALSFAPTLSGELNTGEVLPWKWQNRDFLLLVTGVGPVNAALHLGKLLGSALSLRGVLNIGIGGSFDPDLYPLRSAALVNREIWPEFGLKTDDAVHPGALGYPLGSVNGERVWDRIEFDSRENIKMLGLHPIDDLPDACSLTVSGATGTLEQAGHLRSLYNAGLENMEGFALAWACLAAGLPFVELRTVSNIVGCREKRYWDIKGGLQALLQSCRALLEI